MKNSSFRASHAGYTTDAFTAPRNSKPREYIKIELNKTRNEAARRTDILKSLLYLSAENCQAGIP